MKRERDHHVEDLSGRITSLDMFTGSLVPRSRAEPVAEPVAEAVARLVPVPRRSRVFLRHGAGAFADLTLTAPRPRPRAVVD